MKTEKEKMLVFAVLVFTLVVFTGVFSSNYGSTDGRGEGPTFPEIQQSEYFTLLEYPPSYSFDLLPYACPEHKSSAQEQIKRLTQPYEQCYSEIHAPNAEGEVIRYAMSRPVGDVVLSASLTVFLPACANFSPEQQSACTSAQAEWTPATMLEKMRYVMDVAPPVDSSQIAEAQQKPYAIIVGAPQVYGLAQTPYSCENIPSFDSRKTVFVQGEQYCYGTANAPDIAGTDRVTHILSHPAGEGTVAAELSIRLADCSNHEEQEACKESQSFWNESAVIEALGAAIGSTAQ